MGIWGAGPFDNDDACDWFEDLESYDDLSVARDALRVVCEPGADLDITSTSAAIAAAEIVAAVAGHGRDELPLDIEEFLDRVTEPVAEADLHLAIQAVDSARSEPSELWGIWDRAGAESWFAELDDLVRRLRSALAGRP